MLVKGMSSVWSGLKTSFGSSFERPYKNKRRVSCVSNSLTRP